MDSLKNRGKDGPFLSFSPSFFLSLFHLYPFPEMVPSSGRITSSTVTQPSFLKTKHRQAARSSATSRLHPLPPAQATPSAEGRAQASPGDGRRRRGRTWLLPPPSGSSPSLSVGPVSPPSGLPCSATTFLLAIRVSLVGNLAAWFSFSSLEVTHFHYPP